MHSLKQTFRRTLRRLTAIFPIRPAPAQAVPALGAQGERRARAFLEAHGVHILAANYRCRHGEIDLIGLDGDTLAFIEVRLRTHPGYGGAAASITAAKQRRIQRTALHWQQRAPLAYRRRPCRFDALLLAAPDDPAPQWLRGAFTARG